MIPAVEAQIDIEALHHNFQRVKQSCPAARVMAVVKADGYGHGMVRIARALDEVDAFVVARVDEALQLQEAGITHSIVILEGFSEPADLAMIAERSLQIVVHHISQVEVLENSSLDRPVDVWLKIDSGMHRMGVPAGLAQSAWARLQNCTAVGHISLMTHLASADDRDSEQTAQQLACFQAATAGQEAPRSIANSAGILGWPETHTDWVRPGIMLYGVSPFEGGMAQSHDLKPVMTLKSRLMAINYFREGEAIGYGASWRCPERMQVGVVACGYGDGYPRHAEMGTPVLINGQRVPLIGRVSMDTLCVDLRGVEAQIGDEAILWGEGLPVEEIALKASTIPYGLLCGVTARVKFTEK